MFEYCTTQQKRKNSIINLLKTEIAKGFIDKYWTSTALLH